MLGVEFSPASTLPPGDTLMVREGLCLGALESDAYGVPGLCSLSSRSATQG